MTTGNWVAIGFGIALIIFGLLFWSWWSDKKKRAEIEKCVWKEIKKFSDDYYFTDATLQLECYQQVENEILDHRSHLTFAKSYLISQDRKMKKIQQIVLDYINLDLLEKQKATRASIASIKKNQRDDLRPTTKPQNPHYQKNDFQTIDQSQRALKKWDKKFVTLDFETANQQRTSICQIGLLVFENNQLITQYSRLIKPTPFHFDPQLTRLHGINRSMVNDALRFSQIWDEIKNYFNGEYVVLAHNAGFDISSVLKHTLDHYKIKAESFNYGCTWWMLKKNKQLVVPSYGLKELSKSKGIDFNHHDALSDCFALSAVIDAYYGDLEEFYNQSLAFGYQLKRFRIET